MADKAKNFTSVTNIIGEGTEFEGRLLVPGSIRIDGKINGEVTVSDMITIGKTGYVKGEILTRDAIIAGRVDGKLIVKNKIELQKNAKVNIDLNCKLLIIEEGVIFDGSCTMSNQNQAKRETVKIDNKTAPIDNK